MEERVVHKVECGTVMGPIWVMGWLFTIGYLGLAWPKWLWAAVLWPLYIGRHLAG